MNPPPASMAPEPSIWHRRHALDKKRREAVREAMAAFDVEHHKAMAALREECGAIGHTFKFTDVGPVGHAWYHCTSCGASRVEPPDGA